MSWARFDDRYDDNRKVKKAWRLEPAAVGIHAMAITYSSRHETDGLVDVDWLTEKMPNPKLRERTVRALVECELFEPLDGEQFLVHDYLKFNPSASKLAEKRKKDAERKAALRANGQDDTSAQSPNGFQADTPPTPYGYEMES